MGLIEEFNTNIKIQLTKFLQENLYEIGISNDTDTVEEVKNKIQKNESCTVDELLVALIDRNLLLKFLAELSGQDDYKSINLLMTLFNHPDFNLISEIQWKENKKVKTAIEKAFTEMQNTNFESGSYFTIETEKKESEIKKQFQTNFNTSDDLQIDISTQPRTKKKTSSKSNKKQDNKIIKLFDKVTRKLVAVATITDGKVSLQLTGQGDKTRNLLAISAFKLLGENNSPITIGNNRSKHAPKFYLTSRPSVEMINALYRLESIFFNLKNAIRNKNENEIIKYNTTFSSINKLTEDKVKEQNQLMNKDQVSTVDFNNVSDNENGSNIKCSLENLNTLFIVDLDNMDENMIKELVRQGHNVQFMASKTSPSMERTLQLMGFGLTPIYPKELRAKSKKIKQNGKPVTKKYTISNEKMFSELYSEFIKKQIGTAEGGEHFAELDDAEATIKHDHSSKRNAIHFIEMPDDAFKRVYEYIKTHNETVNKTKSSKRTITHKQYRHNLKTHLYCTFVRGFDKTEHLETMETSYDDMMNIANMALINLFTEKDNIKVKSTKSGVKNKEVFSMKMKIDKIEKYIDNGTYNPTLKEEDKKNAKRALAIFKAFYKTKKIKNKDGKTKTVTEFNKNTNVVAVLKKVYDKQIDKTKSDQAIVQDIFQKFLFNDLQALQSVKTKPSTRSRAGSMVQGMLSSLRRPSISAKSSDKKSVATTRSFFNPELSSEKMTKRFLKCVDGLTAMFTCEDNSFDNDPFPLEIPRATSGSFSTEFQV